MVYCDNMKTQTLFEKHAAKTSIICTQDCEGGVIWIQTKGEFPITPEDLKEIINNYKEKI